MDKGEGDSLDPPLNPPANESKKREVSFWRKKKNYFIYEPELRILVQGEGRQERKKIEHRISSK